MRGDEGRERRQEKIRKMSYKGRCHKTKKTVSVRVEVEIESSGTTSF